MDTSKEKGKILEKLKVWRNSAWNAEVVANELKNKPRELVCRTRREAFEDAIKIVEGKL